MLAGGKTDGQVLSVEMERCIRVNSRSGKMVTVERCLGCGRKKKLSSASLISQGSLHR